jgi:hypothetical protein
MVLPENTLVKLMGHITEDSPVASGIYFKRKYPAEPLVYEMLPDGLFRLIPCITSDIMKVDGIGFGCVLTHISAFTGIEEPFKPEIKDDGGILETEDLVFCRKFANIHGNKNIILDTTVECGHVGYTVFNSKYWFKFKPTNLEEMQEKIGNIMKNVKEAENGKIQSLPR